MIQYTLRCDRGHSFDSWFKSSHAFDALTASGLLNCAVCGSAHVGKAMMAPRVGTSRPQAGDSRGTDASGPSAGPPASRPAATTPDPDLKRALTELRRRVEAQSDYVGAGFAREARAMHLGDARQRSIHGEATATEARSLLEDGVPIVPLPFTPSRKAN